MKKILALILALLFCVSFAACGGNVNNTNNAESTDLPKTDAQTDTQTEAQTEAQIERVFEFVSRSDDDKIKEGTYTAVSKIDSKYVAKKSGNTIYLKYNTPEFELGGLKAPSENKGVFYRLDATKKAEYSKLTNSKVSSVFATHSSGGTLRFRTNSTSIIVSAKVKNYDSGIQIVGNGGTYGFDVYVGSGTAREYSLAKGQMLANASSFEETIKLPGGYVEVLINFPVYAELLDISIGFENPKSTIAAPLARDHAPIVFYGGASTQGLGSSRPGVAYANTVCRMLNTDCINQGYANGAYGEQIIADYIAGLEMSAFVMDYDFGPDLDTLKATHYNFYKTIRDAHPNIPIVMITKPIFTPEPTAADVERADVIRETYKKAMDAGDENVYFINGDIIFPSGAMSDLFSMDMEHLSDTGMFYMAMSIYDVLSEAYAKLAQ